jgi:Fe-S oxidoreductase
MPSAGRKVPPVVVEKERATVASTISGREVELPAAWNRMFEPRVLTDYGPDGFATIAALPGGESLEWCYACGKCVAVCPVDMVGDYGPRKIHRKVQTGTDLLAHTDLWLCTTCGNCLRVCPKRVDMTAVIPAAREAALNGVGVPAELQDIFEKTFRHGNALGQAQRRRAQWAEGAGAPVRVLAKDPRPVDVLFYVEDYWSFHPRGQDAARAFARVASALGIDWAILGPEEKTIGDSQRLAGERGLFDALADDIAAVLAKYEFARIVTPDPHAFNALLREYPRRGHTFDVLHYTQLLSPLVDEIRWARELPLKVTFHDPCYLGRQNGEYDAPRALLAAIPGVELVEMGRCRQDAYCCGGGGGGMWLDGFSADHVTERLSERRVREAAQTGADVLAVCCPYEVPRFADAAKATGHEDLRVCDIVELVDEAMTDEALAEPPVGGAVREGLVGGPTAG